MTDLSFHKRVQDAKNGPGIERRGEAYRLYTIRPMRKTGTRRAQYIQMKETAKVKNMRTGEMVPSPATIILPLGVESILSRLYDNYEV